MGKATLDTGAEDLRYVAIVLADWLTTAPEPLQDRLTLMAVQRPLQECGVLFKAIWRLVLPDGSKHIFTMEVASE